MNIPVEVEKIFERVSQENNPLTNEEYEFLIQIYGQSWFRFFLHYFRQKNKSKNRVGFSKEERADEEIDLGYKDGKEKYNSPFCLCFVYTPDNRLTIVKGYYERVIAYRKKNFPDCICNITTWNNGLQNVSHWNIYLSEEKKFPFPYYTFSIEKHNGRKKWVLKKNERNTKKVIFTFKRFPKRWGGVLKEVIKKSKFIDREGMSIYI
jgi:hypothetical protein